MKTDEPLLKTVELCGRIAVLVELNKWGSIQDLLNQFGHDAWRQGMSDAAEIAKKRVSLGNNIAGMRSENEEIQKAITAASAPSSSASAKAVECQSPGVCS